MYCYFKTIWLAIHYSTVLKSAVRATIMSQALVKVKVKRGVLLRFYSVSTDVDSKSVNTGTDSLSGYCQNEYSHPCTAQTVTQANETM